LKQFKKILVIEIAILNRNCGADVEININATKIDLL